LRKKINQRIAKRVAGDSDVAVLREKQKLGYFALPALGKRHS
jgi:hypothetical protein